MFALLDAKTYYTFNLEQYVGTHPNGRQKVTKRSNSPENAGNYWFISVFLLKELLDLKRPYGKYFISSLDARMTSVTPTQIFRYCYKLCMIWFTVLVVPSCACLIRIVYRLMNPKVYQTFCYCDVTNIG